ncbi:hypothetical protein V5O48_008354 [Marasmius crinis-equi]|uniref:SET domain-containing protein n=1 Tax=Marasmius crinis-equi TaxID=585013 RepID=A0ABR3FEL6_9AGAR
MPGFPQPILRPPNNVVRHRIGRSRFPGGGLGVFATVDIKQGDLVFSERPFFISLRHIPCAFNELWPELAASKGIRQRETDLKMMLNRMPEEDRKTYLSLHSFQEDKEMGPLTGIFHTNSFSLDQLVGSEHVGESYSGVFRDGSRINTSCSPSLGCWFNLPTFAMEFRAVRNIKQGEELTIKYFQNVLEYREERHVALANYGFTCECHSCKRWPYSDLARASILLNQDPKRWRLVLWLMKQELKGVSQGWVVEQSVRTVQAIEQEGLEVAPPYYDHLAFLVDAYCAMGNVKEAVTWLRKFEATKRVGYGGEEKSVRELLHTVKSHRTWDWASRVKAVIMHTGIASA